MLSLRGLTKYYGKHLAVDGLSFYAASGKSPGSWAPRVGEEDHDAVGAGPGRALRVAHRAQIRLDELSTHTASLEQAYTEPAASSVRFAAAKPSERALPTPAVGGDRADHDKNGQA